MAVVPTSVAATNASPPGSLDDASFAADADYPLVSPARTGDLGLGGATYQPERAPFLVSVDQRLILWKVMAVPVLPGQSVLLRASVPWASLGKSRGSVVATEEGWRWTAPADPGIEAVRIENEAGEFVHVNFLILRPTSDLERGSMDGYRIGTYRGDADPESPYAAPEGFVEVREGDEDVLLSPHFTLGQFLCKQEGSPRFAVVSTALVAKLEAVLEEVNEAGYRSSTLHVMSGYRTPWYNRAIGNRTTRSRHLWGDAADVWVDADGNGEMDDLNRDGRVNLADARVLAAIVERVEDTEVLEVQPGGIGLYKRNRAHGPFVHVDARGHSVRW